ncbi:unnamed protein product [Rotaria magnacalcarata]
MEIPVTISDYVEQLLNPVDNTANSAVTTNIDQHAILSNIDDAHSHQQTANETILINISQINSNIIYPWKIRALVTCAYPKRTFTNTHGTGEISNWDLTDQSGSITLIAFNINSHIMSDKIKKDQAYEFFNLSCRGASEAFKTLPHLYQLVCTNSTRVEEIDISFDNKQENYNFIHLNEVNSIPLNSIVDVQVRVLRDYGISTGTQNENVWSRRDLHVDQDGTQLKMTLWNNQARSISRSMVGLKIKLKNVKISWFNGILSNLIYDLQNNNEENSSFYISIENDSNSRQFCYLTLDELISLYRYCPVIERTLYEVIISTNFVKIYIDFEYYINNNKHIKESHIGPQTCLKIFQYFFNIGKNINSQTTNSTNLALQEFLVLEASTTEKKSFHFIHANPSILFENNITLGLFIKIMIHYCLWLTAKHKCSFFDINLILKKYSIIELISLLTPYVTTLCTHCTECQLFSNSITIAELAYLLVLNKQDQFRLAIDLNVYSNNQQFRLFDSVKRGMNNALLQSKSFPFNNKLKTSYFEILEKSIVSNVKEIYVPIISLENNQFIIKQVNSINSSVIIDTSHMKLNDINIHADTYLTPDTNSQYIINSKISKMKQIPTRNVFDQIDNQIHKFIPFVEKLINLDPLHQGYISSCIRGNHNTDIFFFNIGGEYRYCIRKGTHHARNTTAILIDIKNET